MSNIAATQERLRAGWRALRTQWRATCDLWDDPVRQSFEREFWAEFERCVPPALEEVRRLGGVIAQARRNVK